MAATFASLKIRNFRLYIIGMNIAFIGVWMLRIAQAWLVLEMTGSGVAVGLVTALMYLPLPLIGSWSGVLADRYRKRPLLMVTATAMGLIALVQGILVVTGVATLWQVDLLVFLFGTASAIDQPTRLSFVVEMVGPESLTNAVALNSASVNAARLIGPALAGVLITLWGPGWVMLAYSASVVVLLCMLAQIRTADLLTSPLVQRAKGQFREGIRYVRHHPELRVVFVTVFFVGAVGSSQETLFPLLADITYGGDAGLYGLFAFSLALGTFAGAIVAARRGRPSLRFFLISTSAFGLLWIVAATMPVPAAFMAVLPFAGIAQMTCITSANAFVQLGALPEMRGRVMALYMTTLLGGAPIGAPLLGWIASAWSPRGALAVSGALTLLGVGLGLLARTPRVEDEALPPVAMAAREED